MAMILSLPPGLLAQAMVQRKVLAAFLCLVQTIARQQVILQRGYAIDSGRALTT
ncbi:hypothetical protein [Mesorhizobium sp. NFR06]|uniref:hypothetical protein n=1 Tax=Mesorhizobium sp. NFR06 TaxID=1566290 RepID=UPI00165ED51E|nr:hypothetical protein [Mesorhizobium sp. NFR06]